MAQLDELYAGDYEGFVGRRNELAKRLRDEGDADAADRVKALKKPSRPAWAINQVSAGQAKLRDQLLSAGTALRQAQEQLVAGKAKGAELRAASEREQAAVDAVLHAVEALAGKAGAKLSPAAAERARQTLHAVARDEDVRREFESHQLTTEHESAGLVGFSLGAASASGKSGGKTRKPTKGERQEAKRSREAQRAEAEARKLGEREKEAERDLQRASKDAKEAQRELERATKALDRVANQATAARERLAELRER